MKEFIVATIIRQEESESCRYSRLFERPINMENILLWAENMGIKDAKLSDIQFSIYDGMSTGERNGKIQI